MKLDSIIYDANTLSTALQGKLIEESPSFKQVFPSEASTALTNLLGGYGSMLQYTIVSALANCYTDTAFSPTAIYQLAETLGNRLHGNVSSQLYCDIERTNLIGVPGVVIPANSVFEVEGVPFFNYHPISFGLNTNKVKDVLLVQGEYTTVEGFANGIAGEKFYFSNDFRCNMNMVKVFINGEEWSTRETFLPLNAENLLNPEEGKTVVLRMDPSGRAYIKFGNIVCALFIIFLFKINFNMSFKLNSKSFLALFMFLSYMGIMIQAITEKRRELRWMIMKKTNWNLKAIL